MAGSKPAALPLGDGSLNNKLASILENRVLGFNKINQSWTQR
ncbi:hypothetical protein R5L32_08670 [Acinetobacter baumannii]|nr:hypothetical protein [Acinetobacter baumannii]